MASPITIPTVEILNAGNANDPGTGGLYGGVAYVYRIGKFEITVGQYTAFVNAVAAGQDTYGLRNSENLSRPPNQPASVRWGDAARFANWMHNGQPTGTQNPSTTEDGSYTLNGANTFQALSQVNRNAGATWVIPTENEWYKAAYHHLAAVGGDSDDYWNYPTQSNNIPYSDQPPGLDAPIQWQTANFYRNDDSPNGYNDGYAVSGQVLSGGDLTNVGSYTQSRSFYGTFDQGGNIAEWNEAKMDGISRVVRGGGSGTADRFALAASQRASYPVDPRVEFGFRVALVPEPSSFVIAALGLIGLAAWGWRRRR